MKMRGFTANELIKIFKKHGWEIANRESSHVKMSKKGNPKIITVVAHKSKEVSRPLAKRLLKDAGLLNVI